MGIYDSYAGRRKHPLGEWVHRVQARKMAARAVRYLGPRCRVVEVGPGDGYFAEICRDAGYAYTALEASAETARMLRARGLRVETGLAPPLPFPDQSADLCCLFHILEHMADAEHAAGLIEEAKRVLDPGGVLALACPNYDAWGRDFYEDYTHTFVTTLRRVDHLLRDSGFTIQEDRYYSGPVFGWTRYFLLAANRLLYLRWLNRCLASERYYNGFLTFLENFFVIARRRDNPT